MPKRRYITYQEAEENYGMNSGVLAVQKSIQRFPEGVFRRIERRAEIDINFFLRRQEFNSVNREAAQEIYYFFDGICSIASLGRTISKIYNVNGSSIATHISKNCFASDCELSGRSQVSLQGITSIRFYKKINRLLKKIFGTSIDDVLDEESEGFDCSDIKITIAKELGILEFDKEDFDTVEDYYNYFEGRRHLNATAKIRAS